MPTFRLRSKLSNALQPFIGYSAEQVTPPQWESAFSSGSWKRLESLTECSHYSVIVGYCDVLKKKRILDVGCGQGFLAERLRILPYTVYRGFDISSVAIAEANAVRGEPRNVYTVDTVDAFTSADQFDVIIFNEVMYYFADPVAVLTKYCRYLDATGHMLISMYKSGRSTAAWALLDRVMRTVDATTVTHISDASWTIKIGTPKSHLPDIRPSVFAQGSTAQSAFASKLGAR